MMNTIALIVLALTCTLSLAHTADSDNSLVKEGFYKVPYVNQSEYCYLKIESIQNKILLQKAHNSESNVYLVGCNLAESQPKEYVCDTGTDPLECFEKGGKGYKIVVLKSKQELLLGTQGEFAFLKFVSTENSLPTIFKSRELSTKTYSLSKKQWDALPQKNKQTIQNEVCSEAKAKTENKSRQYCELVYGSNFNGCHNLKSKIHRASNGWYNRSDPVEMNYTCDWASTIEL